MAIAPVPSFPERTPTFFDQKVGESIPGNEGPHLFQEGLGSDPDIPADFVTGIRQGETPAPGRPNRNAPVFIKPPAETMKQRAHAGSASWVEAPTFLREFVQGSFTNYDSPQWELEMGSETRLHRAAPNVVRD
jgi:hypothetical protein